MVSKVTLRSSKRCKDLEFESISSQSMPGPAPLSIYIPSLSFHTEYSGHAPPVSALVYSHSPSLSPCMSLLPHIHKLSPLIGLSPVNVDDSHSQLSPLAIKPVNKPFSDSPLGLIVLVLVDIFALYPPAV